MWRWLRRLFRRDPELKLYPTVKKIAKIGDDGVIHIKLSDMPPMKNGDTAFFTYRYPKHL